MRDFEFKDQFKETFILGYNNTSYVCSTIKLQILLRNLTTFDKNQYFSVNLRYIIDVIMRYPVCSFKFLFVIINVTSYNDIFQLTSAGSQLKSLLNFFQLFKRINLLLFGRQILQRHRERPSHPLIHSLNGCQGQSWAHLKMGARSLFWDFYRGAEPKELGHPSSTAFLRHKQERWSRSGAAGTQTNTHTGCACHKAEGISMGCHGTNSKLLQLYWDIINKNWRFLKRHNAVIIESYGITTVKPLTWQSISTSMPPLIELVFFLAMKKDLISYQFSSVNCSWFLS